MSQISSREALRSLEREIANPEEDAAEENEYEMSQKRATFLPQASPDFSPKKTIVEKEN